MKTAKEYIAERINPRACEEMEFSLTGKELFELMEEYAQKFGNSSNSKPKSAIPPVSGSVCEHDFKPCDHLAIFEFDKCTKCGIIR